MGKEIDITPMQSVAVTPSAMISQAIANGAGIEVMEKLMALHERWEAVQARKAFDNAMAELRQNMPTVVKGQTADFGKGKASYRYEDLSAVTEALSPIMAATGLSFRWRTGSTPNGVSVTCIVSHRDGHSEETTLSAGMDTSGSKNAIQALGSAVTYLQRYTLKAAVGIAAAKDDDGDAAGADDDRPSKINPVDHDQLRDALEKEIDAAKTIQVLQKIRKRMDTTPSTELPDDIFNVIAKRLDDRAEILAPSGKVPADGDFPGDLTDPKATLDRQFGTAA
jgi:hypothetical protein